MAARLEVVVFTHNHEAFVERALRSVLSQKTDFEISLRIHDDASIDRTVEVITELLSGSDVSWSLTQAPENRYSKGISFFHEFIAECRAEFIALLDGDDFWMDNNKLQEQVNALDRFPGAALCHHPVMEFAAGELTPIEWPPADFRQDVIPGSKLTVQNVISASSVVLRASMFPKSMSVGFNDLRIGDYPMWSLATAGHDIAFVDRAMSAYRVHDSNIWASLRTENRFDRELEARIYISNNVAREFRAEWRSGIVDAVKSYLDSGHVARELERVTGRLELAERKLDIQAAELFAVRQQTQQILASRSWRLTKPLRKVVAVVKGVRRA